MFFMSLAEIHVIIDLSKFNFTKESNKQIVKQINALDNIYRIIIEFINQIKESNELQINLWKYFTYEYEKIQNYLNVI